MSTAIPIATTPRPRRISAVQQVYDALRARIVSLDLPPGAVLAKQQLAAEHGVSQTPVREALQRLAEEGLVDIYPQSRTLVALIDLQQAREGFVLRLSIDVEVARTLAPVITGSQVAELRGLVARQEHETGDLGAFTAWDHAFHQRIYELGGVGGLWPVVRARHGHLDRVARLHLPEPGKTRTILAHHRSIVDGLASGDPARAEAAARDHLGAALAAADSLRERFPHYFG